MCDLASSARGHNECVPTSAFSDREWIFSLLLNTKQHGRNLHYRKRSEDDMSVTRKGKARKPPSTLRRLLRYAKPYWISFAGATIFGTIKFLTPVFAIQIVRQAVDVLDAAGNGDMAPEAVWAKLQSLAIFGSALALGSFIPTYLRSAIGARAVQAVIRDLRCDLYAHMQKLSHSFFDRHRSGSLTSRLIGDVETIQPFLNQGLIQGWMNMAVISYVLILFFSQNVWLALLSMSLIPIHLLIQRTIRWRVRDNAKHIRDQLAGLAGDTQEKLAASTIVKAFTREDDEVMRFNQDSNTLIDLGVRNSLLNGFSQAATTSLNALAPILVFVFGGYIALFHIDGISIGLLVQFIMMQGQLYGPFERLNDMQLVTANALGATDRIFSIFDTEPEVADRPEARKAGRFAGEIRVDGVTFSYPNAAHPTLVDLSLYIPAKSTLALVGPSGSGKTTITSLLNRFYEWEEGEISIDGRDLRDYTIYSLRHQMALVPQDPILFSGSIQENIAYGRPDASFEQIEEAARRAYAHDFISELEDGYDALLGERGLRLSGGQKQRIAIARAFLIDPSILILDEATSALDSESEGIIQRALEELMRGRTTLVIAHRLATIRRADQIAVLEGGRLLACGPHEALLETNALYARLCRQQFLLPAPAPGTHE